MLLSRNEAYNVRSLVIVAPVTTRIRHIPSEVPLGIDDGMPQDCVANLDTITTIPKDCLQSRLTILSTKKLKEIESARLTILSTKKLKEIESAIRFALGMEQ
jgi:mRNA interferase MazF